LFEVQIEVWGTKLGIPLLGWWWWWWWWRLQAGG